MLKAERLKIPIASLDGRTALLKIRRLQLLHPHPLVFSHHLVINFKNGIFRLKKLSGIRIVLFFLAWHRRGLPQITGRYKRKSRQYLIL